MNLETNELRVGDLLSSSGLSLEVLAGRNGLDRRVLESNVQKPGLALAGHLESIHVERVQVAGYSEISYLESLPEEMAWQRVRDLCSQEIPCIIVTRSLDIPACLVKVCSELDLPLLRTHLPSAELIDELRTLLWSRLSPSTNIHGVLVDVFGVGVLLLGKSGIGKSETALELVMEGHRLVADDIVEVRLQDGNTIVGSGPELIRHHMEIRGLGIINIKDLYGISAVREHKKLELVVELVEWDAGEEYDRLGVDNLAHSLLGLQIPKIRLPVRPGRNIATIIQVAARNQLLKIQGHHSAREFQERLIRAIEEPGKTTLLDGDVE